MDFDVSQANMFLECQAMWYERYVNKRQIDEGKLGYTPGYVFGGRFHTVLESHYTGKPLPPPTELEAPLENDVQVMFEMYKLRYPQEDFDVVVWEKNFKVGLGKPGLLQCVCGFGVSAEKWDGTPLACPECREPLTPWWRHNVTGRWDAIVRMHDTGRLKILDTKTESRNSKANSNERWATLDQGSIYMYAGAQVYGEEFDGILLNVCTKGSPKGQKPPEFPPRLHLERSTEQLARAVVDFVKIGDAMELCVKQGPIQHREVCINKMTGWKCDYYPLHLIGESPETLFNFKEAEDYLGEGTDGN